VFDLTDGNKVFPKVQLGRGERMLLLVTPDGRDGRKVQITRPPVALELARKQRLPFAPENSGGPGVALSLTQLRYTPRDKDSTLEAVVAFEKLDPNPDPERLRSASRDYAWFDLAPPPNGKPFDPANPPKVTVRNHLERSKAGDGYELLAPAWDITIDNWDPAKGRTFRRPDVTGYWVNGLPDNHPEQVVTPEPPAGGTPGGLPLKAFEFASGKADVLDAVVRERDGKLYATVWIDYRKPGELVLLRPREWQKDRVPESHTYYEQRTQPNEYGRYTAEFGPLSPAQLGKPVTFELYTVKALKQRAIEDKLTVQLDGKEDCGDADQYRELPDRLKMVGKAK
jgi:hypothetical protein